MGRRQHPDEQLGTYVGINPDGKLRAVQSYATPEGVRLSLMNEDAVVFEYIVPQGKDAGIEVILVFHLRDVEYIHARASDEEQLKVMQRVKSKAQSRD